MRSAIGQQEEKRLGRVTSDKGDCLARERVCQIRGLRDRCVVPKHRDGWVVWRFAPQEPEELVKPSLHGTKILRST